MLEPLQRLVKPELLDELPAADPRAIQSRRDLQRVNRWMGNVGIMTRAMEHAWTGPPPCELAEIGAGDGSFLLRVARQLSPVWPRMTVTLVDRQDVVRPETIRQFEAIGWSVRPQKFDVFEWLEAAPRIDLIVANLFLHHFTERELKRLLSAAAQRASVLVAVEPRRCRLSLIAGHLLWAIGCNDVTRHDALVSIRAGFDGQELSSWWPDQPGWQLTERAVNFSSHLFVACRQMVPSNEPAAARSLP